MRTILYQQIADELRGRLAAVGVGQVLPSEAEVQLVLNAASSGAKTALELIQTITPERQAFVFRSLVWLVKLGILKVCK
jgi:hypothetical protein